MDRRRGMPSRPASSEEVECWSHAAESLRILSKKYSETLSLETIGRVNRLMSAWPTDDNLPAEGWKSLKDIYKKLQPGLLEVKQSADDETKMIDDTIERVGVLIALRKAPEQLPPEKRNKRPRAPSPSGTPTPTTNSQANNRGVSITLPPRTNSVGPSGHIRKRDTKPQPLQAGRKVAFRPDRNSGNAETDENTWMLAIVLRCTSSDKGKFVYEVRDADPLEGTDVYTTTHKNMIPLPEPQATNYPEFSAGSTVLALYPDTSCFYRAEVLATPKDMQPAVRNNPSAKQVAVYKLKFEDDEDQESTVAAEWVVEYPG